MNICIYGLHTQFFKEISRDSISVSRKPRYSKQVHRAILCESIVENASIASGGDGEYLFFSFFPTGFDPVQDYLSRWLVNPAVDISPWIGMCTMRGGMRLL